jgi:hypothetical protein
MYVATECLEVINNLNKQYLGEYGVITREIKETASLFSASSFKHKSRASNREAHRLARSSLNLEVGRRVWLLQPPAGLCIPQNFPVNE